MGNLKDLEKRMRFFGINTDTKRTIGEFYPLMLRKIDSFADNFYAHTLNFPEAKRILQKYYDDSSLKDRQVKHWIRLFSCKFDQEYLNYAMKIGQIHYQNKVSPYLYIGGYNFLQCELLALASENYPKAETRNRLLMAITRLIALDTDIAMSAYTRALWTHGGAAAKKSASPKPVKKRDEMATFDIS